MADQRQASAASAQGQYAKAVDYENARLSDLEAKDATDRGQLDAQRQGLATRQAVGSSRAALAAQGVDVSSGSAADVQASESASGALDELTIRNNAAREAWGYTVQGVQQRREGDVAAITGDMTASGLRAQSWSDLLSGAAQTYGIYQNSRDTKRNLTGAADKTGKPTTRRTY
jgi:hypothetical protein